VRDVPDAAGDPHLLAQRPDEIIAGEDEEAVHAGPEQGPDFALPDVDGAAQQPGDHPTGCCLAFQAARTSASRSGAIPDLSFAWRSAGSVRNQSSVDFTVSMVGWKVRPFPIALAHEVREKPALSPVGGTQTGMSDQASTFCSARKSALAQTKFALPPPTLLQASRSAPIPTSSLGPVLGPVAL